jgi:nicotinamide mononucleotide transporter
MVSPEVFMQIFTLLTGVAYVILEIRQKNLMWAVGVVTGIAAMWVFFRQGLYASFGLNTYYLFVSFWGLWQWSRTKRLAKDALPTEDEGGDVICLRHITPNVLAVSVLLAVAGTVALSLLMERFENPMSWLDSSVAVLSALATWWLGRSYLEQWYVWIAADCVSVILCISQGLWWMVVMYVFYTVAAAYGLVHWKMHGKYVD